MVTNSTDDAPSFGGLNNYVRSAPSPQTSLDIFKGEWVSKMPGAFGQGLNAGSIPVFEDPRLDWALEQIADIKGMTVLELGPLEAGHTYMLERREVGSIISIEANTRAYLKCLIIKELFKLNRVSFLCGDFVEHLRANEAKFDLCLASGVLYHMRNPVELIALAARASDRLYLWTHYYDQQIMSGNPPLASRFPKRAQGGYGGYSHTLYRYEYQEALNFQGFCGGSAEYSHWLTRKDILACLNHFDFNEIQINFEQPDHQNGPSVAILAVRRE